MNPYAIEKVAKSGYPLENLRSKSWDEFSGPDAPRMDFIITVCDNAAGEICPIWPGHPTSAHWSFQDPAAVEGTDDEKRAAFDKVFRQAGGRALHGNGVCLEPALQGRPPFHLVAGWPVRRA